MPRSALTPALSRPREREETGAARSLPADAWRQTHLGRLLGAAMRRFDERVF